MPFMHFIFNPISAKSTALLLKQTLRNIFKTRSININRLTNKPKSLTASLHKLLSFDNKNIFRKCVFIFKKKNYKQRTRNPIRIL